MKKVILAILLVLAPILAVADNSVEITGYGPGEFAVKGKVETQMNKVVDEIWTQLQQAHSTDTTVEITIIGYADTATGTSGINDEIGLKRSEQMKFILSGKFPNAKIISLTKGDSENLRKVVVSWNIKTKVITKADDKAIDIQKTNYASLAWKIAIIFCIAILILIFKFFLRTTKNDKICMRRWETITINGKQYSFEINMVLKENNGKKESLYQLPFKSMNNSLENICWKTYPDAIKSMKGCLKNEKYAKQLASLIKSGSITVKDVQTNQRENSNEDAKEEISNKKKGI